MLKRILFMLIVILIVGLLWYFLVPHYSKKDCTFTFWGEYMSKKKCESKNTYKKVRFIDTPDYIYYDPDDSPNSLKG